MYERKICYLNYYERNVRVKNAGYVKLSLHDDRFGLEVKIKGLGASESFQAWIELEGMEGMLAPIQIQQGCGSFQKEYDAEHIGDGSVSVYTVSGLKIPLPGERMIRTEFSFQENRAREEKKQKIMSHPVTEEMDDDLVEYKADSVISEMTDQIETDQESDESVIFMDDIKKETANTTTSDTSDDDADSESDHQSGQAAAGAESSAAENTEGNTGQQYVDEQVFFAAQAQRKQESRYANRKPLEIKKSDQNTMEEYISADKWEQLCRTYHQIHPFKGRTYIRLAPKDFVILRKEYQQLVNNSFLLHGFYNYRHLILGKESVEEGEVFYLGVPGTYYDREKMVAVMFGFEGFEASEVSGVSETAGIAEIASWRGGQGAGSRNAREKQTQEIRPGTFGYYMKRVEI